MKAATTLAGLFALVVFIPPEMRAQAPAVTSVSPTPGSTVSSLTQITVTFTESVVNVQPSDLIINEQPAASRTGAGATYTFTFSQPPPGFVAVDFDTDTGIADLTGTSFDPSGPGASWSYTVADTVAPTALITPAPGALLSELTTIQVAFSEAVTGVNASDLLINSSPATSVTTIAPDRYAFQFPEAPTGTANIAWAGGHGITDLAVAPNAFAGGNWTYTVDPVAAFGDVVINEILAENLTSLVDEDDQKHDWIELYNRGLNSVNLLGWSLTDDPANPGKWTFPAVTLDPGKFLVVFASEKDRKTNTTPRLKHTNFRLNLLGGYLGLYNASLQAVNEFASYPEQRADISYGLTTSGIPAYFGTVTPGTNNASASGVEGFCQPPDASVDSGLFSESFCLVLSSPTTGADIFYTLDGSPPTATSFPYIDPIVVSGTPAKGVVLVRAAAFRDGLLPSTITTRTFIFPEHVLSQPANPAGFPTVWDSPCSISGINCSDAVADYEMDPQVLTNSAAGYRELARQGLLSIPSISIVTHSNLLFGPAQGVYVRREPFNQQQVNAEMINPDGSSGFNIPAGLEIVGGTSPNDQGSFWKSRKLSMRLMFRGDFGATKLRHQIFPDSTVDSFDTVILDAGLNYVWSYNGTSSPDDQRQRAQYVRDQFMSDLQNAMGHVGPHGRPVHVYLNGLYWGLYGMHERPDHSFSAEHFGGDKADYDVIKHRIGTVVNGSSANYTAMFNFARTGLAGNANYETLQQQYLDLPWFIDYMIMNFWAGNDDWAHQNWYASRRRVPAGLWRYLSWDAEHVLKSLTYNSVVKNDANGPTELFNLLRNNAEFRLKFADHVHKHFFNSGVFHVENTSPVTDANLAQNRPASLYMRRIVEIGTAIVTESARWGDTGETGTPRANTPLTRNVEWTNELNGLMGRTTLAGYSANYFPQRSATVLNQLRAAGVYPSNLPPIFSQHGGRVAPGFAVYMTNLAPGSTVYYTTNGVDPRVYGSSAISAHALQYTGGPIILSKTSTLKARSLLSTNWSALNEASFVIGELGTTVAITEIMYNPVGGDAHEFIELQNFGSAPVDLSGHYFVGVNFTFPAGSILAPGARVILASSGNPGAFASQYPGVSVYGYYGAQLANGGERLALLAPGGRIVLSVDYDDENGWPTEPDGRGGSLEIIDINGSPDDPANWRPSAGLNGTPGQENSAPPAQSVVLNEVLASDGGDWVELRNTSVGAADLTGWSLTDDGAPRKFLFPNGTSISVGGHLLVYCDMNSSPPGLHTGFGLSSDSGKLLLYNSNTGRVDAISFGKQAPGYSIGRTTAGWELMTPTPGTLNNAASALAAPASIAINEWLADPSSGQSDWVELHNASSLPASIGGAYLGTSDAVFRLPTLTFLGPGGFIQLLADELPGVNHVDFRLPGSGGQIVYYDAAANEIDRIAYGLQVETVSQGRLPDGAENIVSFPGTASPGASNYVSTYSGPYINEVMARNQLAVQSPWGAYADWIEIYNPGASPFSLAGLSLTDSLEDPIRWTFPLGVSIAGNSYIVVWCDGSRAPSTVSGGPLNTGFNLSADSGGVYLVGNVGQVLDSVEYGPQASDLSIGRAGGQWRLLANPTPGAVNSAVAVLGNPAGLRINEWMAASTEGDDWFELYNTNAQPVELTGLYVTDDLSVAGRTASRIGPLSFIGPRGFAVLEADGNPGNGRHHVNFSLNASGESIRLYTAGFVPIDTVYFGAQVSDVSEGRLPDGQGTVVRFPGSASPGESNYRPLSDVLITEVLSHSDPPLQDAIELHNISAQSVNIGGWYLSDHVGNLRKFRIPAGTILTGNQFHVFYEAQLNGGVGSLVPFTFDSVRGDRVYLSQADGADNLIGYRSQVAFGAAENAVSFGRHISSVAEEFVAQSERTLGASNAYPRVGPVVINELMYHPLDDSADDEYIELYNVTTNTVPLHDPTHATNTWRLRDGIDFDFPAGITLAPRAYLLVVNFDPADTAKRDAFRATFGIPSTVPLYGPYQGKLDNAGESIELLKPDPPQTSGPDAGYVPYVLVERVAYDDETPWPGEPDGTGPSLQRRRPHQFGNEPLNWKSAQATPGRANVPNAGYVDFDQDGMSDDWENEHNFQPAQVADAHADADGDGSSNYQEFLDGTDPHSAGSVLVGPVIVAQPQDQTVMRGSNATFSVTASGAPLNYQWRLNGITLPGRTNASLLLQPVQTSDAGDYTALVYNSAGFAVSRAARLIVNQPPRITQQPQGARVPTNSTVTLTVSAVGTGTLHYQWQFNGVNIDGATSDSLELANLQVEQTGDYRVLVTDDIGTIASDIATLIVLQRPSFAIPPEGKTVAVGQSASFTVVARGTLPIHYRWRRLNSFITDSFVTVHSTTNTYTLQNVQTNDAVYYSVTLTNVAGLTGISPFAYLVVVIPPTNQTVAAGSDVTFQTVAVGRPQVRYQWHFNGAPLIGQTNAALALSNVGPAQAGTYAVTVTPFTNTVVLPGIFAATLALEGTPPELAQPRLLDGGVFRMIIQGQDNADYVIEASTNLIDWTNLGIVTATNSLMPYTDAGAATNAPRRFYRAIVP